MDLRLNLCVGLRDTTNKTSTFKLGKTMGQLENLKEGIALKYIIWFYPYVE